MAGRGRQGAVPGLQPLDPLDPNSVPTSVEVGRRANYAHQLNVRKTLGSAVTLTQLGDSQVAAVASAVTRAMQPNVQGAGGLMNAVENLVGEKVDEKVDEVVNDPATGLNTRVQAAINNAPGAAAPPLWWTNGPGAQLAALTAQVTALQTQVTALQGLPGDVAALRAEIVQLEARLGSIVDALARNMNSVMLPEPSGRPLVLPINGQGNAPPANLQVTTIDLDNWRRGQPTPLAASGHLHTLLHFYGVNNVASNLVYPPAPAGPPQADDLEAMYLALRAVLLPH